MLEEIKKNQSSVLKCSHDIPLNECIDCTQKQNEVEQLIKGRSDLHSIRSNIGKLFRDPIEKLENELIASLKNIIIISGALASIALLILSNPPNHLTALLITSIIGFLLTILFSVLWINKATNRRLKFLRKQSTENITLPDEGIDIYNDRLDGKITAEKFDEKITNFFLKVEQDVMRRSKPQKATLDHSDELLTYLFILSIVGLIFYFLFDMLLNVIF